MATAEISPFHIAVPESDLIDLRGRLANTRPPREISSTSSTDGVTVDTMGRFLD